MNKEDFVIQSEVRRMIVRANIDQTKIDFGTVRGVVYFRGIFQPINLPSGSNEAMETYVSKTLFSFEKKIRSISGVSDIVFQFINWKKEQGHWIPVRLSREGDRPVKLRDQTAEESVRPKKEEKDEDQTDSNLPQHDRRDPKGN